MLLALACMLAAVAAAPSYDQRQDGKYNVQADIRNILFVIGIPKKIPASLLQILSRNSKRNGDESIAQDRADVHIMDAFVEPNTPYRVVIGAASESERSVEADGDEAIIIAGRHRSEEEGDRHEEMKLIGATEQCGPERERDPVTLTCRAIKEAKTNAKQHVQEAPEVVPILT